VSSTVNSTYLISFSQGKSLAHVVPAGVTEFRRAFTSPREEAPHGAIISIGLKTEGILKSLEISEQVVPHLRFLIRNTSSQRWAAELKKSAWGFSSDEAAQIASALVADLTASGHPLVSHTSLLMGGADYES
jgi:hypothetical protein